VIDMASVKVACPKCKKTIKTAEEAKGKRIRCPSCKEVFVVKEFVGQEEPPPEPKVDADPNEADDGTAYGVRTVTLKSRCPNCANEMQSDTAVICLYCGYNTQTRTLGQTKRVVDQTGGDRSKWLLPGVICFIAAFGLVLFQSVYVLGFAAKYRGEDWWLWNFLFSEPLFLWCTLLIAGGMWFLGRFAFRRLILEPTPPEDIIE
jgi:hypothetical protein